ILSVSTLLNRQTPAVTTNLSGLAGRAVLLCDPVRPAPSNSVSGLVACAGLMNAPINLHRQGKRHFLYFFALGEFERERSFSVIFNIKIVKAQPVETVLAINTIFAVFWRRHAINGLLKGSKGATLEVKLP